MKEKIAIATCSGMSPNGLIGRAVVSDMAVDFEEIISICMGATSADSANFIDLVKKYPVVAINGCEGNCVNKILKNKGANVKETFNIPEILKDTPYRANDVARLDAEGEKCVEEVKKVIKSKLLD